MRRNAGICSLALALTAALALAAPATGATYAVNPQGTGDFPTIQQAIDAVAPGDIIHLTDGTFAGGGNRDLDFRGKAITVCSQSGSPEACIIDCEGSETDPHRGFSFVTGEPTGAEVSGLTITHGWATGEPGGGAILCTAGSSPTIENCIFTLNRDAALSCDEWSGPALTGCLFLRNAGTYGGAISSTAAFPTASDCEFVENTASAGGGAVHGQAGDLGLAGCAFLDNVADGWGGALALLYGCTGTVTDCLFQGNAAVSSGAVNLHFANGVFERCTFTGNEAMTAGAFGTSKMTVASLTSCTFWGNLATHGATIHGGELVTHMNRTIIAFNLGGPAIELENEVHLTCCDIHGNEGGDWVGGLEPQYGINGNISADPLFCDPENGDFTLAESSPCAPFTAPNPECDLIGAWPVGCGGTPVAAASWGAIKALFAR